MSSTLFYGTFIHSKDKDELEIFEQTAVLVSADGKIESIHKGVSENELVKLINNGKIVKIPKNGFVLPGFIDTHTHASQYPNMGNGMDLQLLDWLDKYTFPMEASFKDLRVAQRVYPAVIRRLLNNGTTTASYYCTTHAESTNLFADLVHAAGQRAFVGKVSMDRECPAGLVEKSVKESIAASKSVIDHVKKINSTLVAPIITPRFAITCTSELLQAIGDLAKSYDPPLHIQTHIAENKMEIEHTLGLFKGSKTYSHVYDDHGVLTPRTILAHAIYHSDEERELIVKRGTGISHCPNSNFNLMSGQCEVRKWWKFGAKVGLGTDVSGGCSPSMLDAMRCAAQTSRLMTQRDGPDTPPLNIEQLIYLATIGGAQVCDVDKIVGDFTVGKEFDAVVVDLGSGVDEQGNNVDDNGLDFFPDDSLLQRLEKFVFSGSEQSIKEVYVRGRMVGGTGMQRV